ncbi:MAG TPA: hypothetical protein DF383_03065 [Deltaproteobacteria bacterium]|nr:hypothetical protein [Deltaproteobacteria bacterium]
MNQEIIYRSKVNPALGILLLLLALTVPACFIMAIRIFPISPSQAIVWAVPGVFTALLLLLVVWPVRYTLTQHDLVIRFGVIRVRISYHSITKVLPTRTILAGPALSMDRLMIHYNDGGLALISPLNKEQFLRDLAGRDPGLLVEGDRIVRKN